MKSLTTKMLVVTIAFILSLTTIAIQAGGKFTLKIRNSAKLAEGDKISYSIPGLSCASILNGAGLEGELPYEKVIEIVFSSTVADCSFSSGITEIRLFDENGKMFYQQGFNIPVFNSTWDATSPALTGNDYIVDFPVNTSIEYSYSLTIKKSRSD